MENFRKAYDINVSGPMLLSQLLVPCMKKSQSPTIVFVTSLCGKIPYRGSGNYSNAKRGEMALIDTMRMEFSDYGIKVTEICPGTIDTQIERKNNALTAEDMAETIRWVSSMPKHVNINHLEISHIFNNKYM
jgi:NADP-dependent 3-hydroxy acid dehydrogenase YdfG